MSRKFSVLWAAFGLLGLASAAGAQVIFTPIGQSGLPGDSVEILISTSGPSAPETTVANVMIGYDPSGSVWDPVADPSTGEVECAAAPDLAGHVQPAPVRAQPQRGRIVMGFGDLEVPLTPFGRAGVVLSCRVTIRPDALPGTYPLPCVGATSASDQYGNEIPSSCVSGVLTVEGAGEAQAGAPVGRQVAPGGVASAPVVGEAVVAGGVAAGAAAAGAPGGQAPAAGAGVSAPKAAPPGAIAREAGAPQAPAPGETGAEPGLPQGPAGVATVLRAAGGTPKASPAAPTAAAATPVPAATRASAAKSLAPAATAAKAQQVAPKPTAKESGCAVSPQSEGGWAWVPALPLLALLLRRHRR